ncbi:cell division protein FtsA [Planococcus glaciei]|uniref:Cell division protein FtsA n=1 Tax=Planococcus glaciei TaxID=459472 RepID=A0A1G8EIM6_9BACL|nr:cell division protein FtsA [Planococcus glaciei]ETP68666.1 cell division protein FtsA [Planococcus glaciei CHR43]KOF10337.1 cell division protein FtsA [Planococcus glaciei]MBX0313681.1 cell division protein FtsA [Planococcus glaciei]QDY44563.1 cell division protein FtsA [Planococcus glaciei]QKX49172.1 cell division protein FtsA [Planococcus glaciei]
MSQSELYVSLDIGSSSVKVLIGEMANKSLHVIGVGNVKSNGIRKGAIVDIDATVQSIKKAVDQAERMIGKSIHEVVLGIPANKAALHPVKGVVAVNSENREITDDDLDRVLEAAQVISIPPERELVNIIPEQYIVDHLDEIKDPRGMIGIRLEMDGTMVTTSKTILHNVLRCVERAGLQIRDIYVQPLVAGYVALTEDEKNHGTACIDIGGGSTSIAVFQDGHLTASSVIPVGGDHVTKDLSIVLKTPTEQAEKIKLEYGHAFYDDASEDELFEVEVIGSDSKEQYSQKYISEIIGVRLEELFELILDELYRLGYQDLPGGVVLTGGMAKLEGLPELARHIMQTRVRLYVPEFIGVREPQYTTAVGLIQYAYMEDMFYGNVGSGGALSESAHVEPEPQHQQPKKQKQPKQSGEGVVTKAKKMFDRFFE